MAGVQIEFDGRKVCWEELDDEVAIVLTQQLVSILGPAKEVED